MPRNLSDSELQRTLRDLLQQLPSAEWVRQMIDHYHRTGAYRAEDLRRLLGDPTRGVEVRSESSLAALLAARKDPSH